MASRHVQRAVEAGEPSCLGLSGGGVDLESALELLHDELDVSSLADCFDVQDERDLVASLQRMSEAEVLRHIRHFVARLPPDAIDGIVLSGGA